ncbi:branched-chain amino acid ABC transporter permease [Rhodococcoides fascians]|uniref:branched-chain amino acid ABC transporter permease n=1 Tax=Rhodococcoides fascians TaxID=1828 RepID=UPI00056D6D3D|nr:branched-chain amino acid ABC transporter permease [Rhodococcus fascians]
MNLTQMLNGVALGSLLMVLSAGLAMILGLRGVTNFAHGALYMLGAYLAYSIAGVLGFWWALILVPLILALVGVVLEITLFRPLQSRPHLEVGLVTFGLALVIERVVVLVWGAQNKSLDPPEVFAGAWEFFGITYPAYRLMVILVAIALAGGLILWLRRSRTGLSIRALSQDGETASILGIDVNRLSLIVVSLGVGIAGFAGAVAAPYVSVDPNMGNLFLITVLIVVVVGGVGSIGGAMVAGMVLGIVQTLITDWAPVLAVCVPYVALVLVLLVRPQGIAGRRLA